MNEVNDFRVRFWGVRGNVACSSQEHLRYGGNTSCLEIRCGEKLLIFDAGTGIRGLANSLPLNKHLELDLFLTHTHLDHVCGFPSFAPAFKPDTQLKIWAGHLLPERKICEVLGSLMADPLWPVQFEDLPANISFCDFFAGDVLRPKGDILIRTAPLNHPNRATGYRIEYCGRSICYITDTEHFSNKLNGNIVDLIENSDVFIYDCTYTDDEYIDHVNWGHSTWQEGVKLANAANVKTFVVFHHDPDHDDDIMDSIATEVVNARPGSVVAKEGMILCP